MSREGLQACVQALPHDLRSTPQETWRGRASCGPISRESFSFTKVMRVLSFRSPSCAVRLLRGAAVAVLFASCAHQQGARPISPVALTLGDPPIPRRSPAQAESYWAPVQVQVAPNRWAMSTTGLSLADVRIDPEDEAFIAKLSPEDRAVLLRDGSLAFPEESSEAHLLSRARLGLDASAVVAWTLHAMRLAFQALQTTALDPGLSRARRTLLTYLSEFERSSSKGQMREISASLAHARAYLAFLEHLENPSNETLLDRSPDNEPWVEEAVSVATGRGVRQSRALGSVIDYGAFADARSGPAAARTWLQLASLPLLAASDQKDAAEPYGVVRERFREVVWFAEACHESRNKDCSAVLERERQLLRFVYGAPIGADLETVYLAAASANVDFASGASNRLNNVATLESLRLATARQAPSRAGRPPRFALLGQSMTPESRLLEQRLQTEPGLELRAVYDDEALRCLGRIESSAHLARCQSVLPEGSEARHETLYATLLDLVGGYLDGSVGDLSEPSTALVSPHAARRTSALAMLAFGRRLLNPSVERTLTESAQYTFPKEDGKLEVWVEPTPETYARLVALVNQAQRGLDAIVGTALPKESHELFAVAHGFAIAALKVSIEETNGAPEPILPAPGSPSAKEPAARVRLGEALRSLSRAVGPGQLDMRTVTTLAVDAKADDAFQVTAKPSLRYRLIRASGDKPLTLVLTRQWSGIGAHTTLTGRRSESQARGEVIATE
jgi:hypothetical protein